jgi:anti-anti-sigma regulatory factor
MSNPLQNASHVETASAENGTSVECAECLEGDRVRGLFEHLQRAINAGHPVTLQATGVRRISTLALQVIAAARTTAQRHRQAFSIPSPSPEFVRACADTGLRRLLSPGD